MIDADHGQFDHVGGSALDGHVDRRPFGIGSNVLVAGVDIGEMAPAATERFDIAPLAGVGDGVFHEGFDGRVFAKIGVDDRCRLRARNGKAL